MSVKKVPILEEFSWQYPVKDKDLTTPPGSPSKGDRYLILQGDLSTSWEGHDGKIGLFTGTGWEFFSPLNGWICWIEDEAKYYYFNNNEWSLLEAQSGDLSDYWKKNDPLEVKKSAFFTMEIDNGNSTGNDTVDWREGNKQKIRLVGDTQISFINPAGAGNFILKIIQDNPGNRKVTTWDSDIKWAEGSVPILTTTFNSIDLISFYFDGVNFYGQIGHNFY